MVLVYGKVNADDINLLGKNVPHQEHGRYDNRCLVLARANRSNRSFSYVIEQLAKGNEPSISSLTEVGYLHRVSAVYGSGKFGMADWGYVQQHYTDFNQPFSAEMLSCFIIRHFSVYQAEHIARHQNPHNFKPLASSLKRHLGIGNSTGLGMAPFLINHPLLINQWVLNREIGLTNIMEEERLTPEKNSALISVIHLIIEHHKEIRASNTEQQAINQTIIKEMQQLLSILNKESNLTDLLQLTEKDFSLHAQELFLSALFEIFPEKVDYLDQNSHVSEAFKLNPTMPLDQVKQLIESRYSWATDIDFSQAKNKHTCWYYSQQKMEPRLGSRDKTEIKEKSLPLAVALAVNLCYQKITAYQHSEAPSKTVGEFILQFPRFKTVIKRIQTMGLSGYGDIQANVTAHDFKPMHLLRCKLAFLGVNKFDPKSDLWVQNTIFQGAALIDEIDRADQYNCFMPTICE